MAYFQRQRGGMPRFMEELKKQLALESITTMQPLTPVAAKKWTPETTMGELKRSVTAIAQGGGYIVGPTAVYMGFPYGIAVKRGKRWGWVDSQAGPRPFDEWTIMEMRGKVDKMASKILEKHMREWS